MRSIYRIVIPGVALLVTLAIYYSFVSEKRDGKKEGILNPEEVEVKLYVPSEEESLRIKRLSVKKPKTYQEMVNLIVEKLKENGVIEEETRLLHFAKGGDGTIYLDFSKDFLYGVDESSEMVKVYSVVNTFLSNFWGAKRVQLLIEGEALYTVGGLLYTYLPLEFNEELLEEE
jgi:spore germination protein GerM